MNFVKLYLTPIRTKGGRKERFYVHQVLDKFEKI